MRTKKTLAILALLMTLAMLLSACGKTEAPAPEQPAETQEAAAGEPAAETGETAEQILTRCKEVLAWSH